jgi:hypothetical protein
VVVEVEVKRTREHFAEAYGEAIRFTRWGRWNPWLVAIFLAAGVLSLIMSPERWPAGAVLIAAAIYLAFRVWYNKVVRLRDRMSGSSVNAVARYSFTEEGVASKGPFSEGVMSWDGVQEARVSAKGLYLLVEKGIGIYLPRSAFSSSAEFDYVVGRAPTVRPR